MSESVYDRVNDYGSVKITLASPNDIRSWSFGEVKKPETINYRTYRPEKDGLFCERIFGPEKDYECGCGKYKGTKYKGIICDRCGVKVTHSRVRRKRMGHINLAAPIVHIWFFKATPSRLGSLLQMKTSDLEKIIYFQDYVVTNPGNTDLDYKKVLTEDEYRQAVDKYGTGAFDAMMGADAIRELLQQLDLESLSKEIREDLGTTKSKQKQAILSKRLKIVEAIRGSNNEPKWMVLDVIPVIPPDLRPLVLLESGNFATSDLNDLYRRIINRNNRLKKLMDLNAPEVIVRNEKRMLQQAVDALFDNGRCRRPVVGSSSRPLKSITDMIKGKQGRFRENLLGKRVDYSARSVIVVGPELKLWQCGLPKKIALELYQPFIIRKLKEHGLADTIKSAKRMLERRDPEVWDILEQVIQNHPVMLNRAPTLHRMGIQAFEPVLVEGNAIKIHPLVCTGYNADFDGDQMAVHLPLSVEAQAETHVLMMSTHNIFSPANGNPIVSPSQDIVMGVYFLTTGHGDNTKAVRRFKDMEEALLCAQLPHGDKRKISFHDPIEVRLARFGEVVSDQKKAAEPMPANRRIVTTLGRLLFSEILPDGMPFYNCALGKKGAARVIDDTFARKGKAATIDLLDAMKQTGFRYSTVSGLSFAITDLRIPAEKKALLDATQKKVDRVERDYEMGTLTESSRCSARVALWNECQDKLTARLLYTLKNDRRDILGRPVSIDKAEGSKYLNPAFVFLDSGARSNLFQIGQLAGMRGISANSSDGVIRTPIRASFREGYSTLEYFYAGQIARRSMAATSTLTPSAGYLTRKLCDVAQSVVVLEDDCGVPNGIPKKAIYKGDEVDVPLRDIIRGRTSVETIINPITEETIVRRNEVITESIARRIEELGVTSIHVRSPLTCQTARGVCAKCYGQDMSTGKPVEIGMAVGIIAAQSIGEPAYQWTFGVRRDAGHAFECSVIQRLAAIFEARAPKEAAAMAEISGRVELYSDKRKGKVTIRVVSDSGLEHDHHVPQGKALLVHTDDLIEAGDALTEGPLIPADVFRINGEDALQVYILDEVQKVYRSLGAQISDKHIEVILRQMLSKVRVSNQGDTELLQNDVVDKFMFRDVNDALARKLRIEDAGGTSLPVGALVDDDEVRKANAIAETEGKSSCKARRPLAARATTLLLGITKASLQAKSFLSSASFQTTTKVLIEAALGGKSDALLGLKENVLLGRLIPAGTGFGAFSKAKVKRLVEEAAYDDKAAAAMYEAAAEEAQTLRAERRGEGATTTRDGLQTMEADQDGELRRASADTDEPTALSRIEAALRDAGYDIGRDSLGGVLSVFDESTMLTASVRGISDSRIAFSVALRFDDQACETNKRMLAEALHAAGEAECEVPSLGMLRLVQSHDCARDRPIGELMRTFRAFLGLCRAIRDGPRYRALFDQTP
jgi:DNA-directed RNA polymerase subunit beta'